MQWTDAAGQLYTGSANGGISGLIPYLATDTSGGAFPGGNVRWTNLGFDSGVAFDLVVSVSPQPLYYASNVAVEYRSPASTLATQAVYTSAGFTCIGFGVRSSLCTSAAALNPVTASCVDGTPTTLRAAEFSFRFVRSGTSTLMPPFDTMYTTFFDVDGDVVSGGSCVFHLPRLALDNSLEVIM